MWAILSLLVENKPGILFKITHLFRSRNFNIDSISVGVTENPNYSKMTITTYGDEKQVDQIVKQLDKLVDVIEVSEITSSDHIEREIVFVKIKDSDIENENLKSLKTNEFLKIHKAENGHAIIECVDSPENVNEFINTVKDIAIKIIRSGAVGIGS